MKVYVSDMETACRSGPGSYHQHNQVKRDGSLCVCVCMSCICISVLILLQHRHGESLGYFLPWNHFKASHINVLVSSIHRRSPSDTFMAVYREAFTFLSFLNLSANVWRKESVARRCSRAHIKDLLCFINLLNSLMLVSQNRPCVCLLVFMLV